MREKIISITGNQEYEVDNIENMIVHNSSNERAKNIILLAHIDEIEFYITNFRDDGKLEIRNVGGIIEETIQGSFVQVITQKRLLKVLLELFLHILKQME